MEEEKIIEVIRCQLNEKQEDCEKLEPKVVFLINELDKTFDKLKFGKGYKILDGILNYQRSFFDKENKIVDSLNKRTLLLNTMKNKVVVFKQIMEFYTRVLIEELHEKD